MSCIRRFAACIVKFDTVSELHRSIHKRQRKVSNKAFLVFEHRLMVAHILHVSFFAIGETPFMSIVTGSQLCDFLMLSRKLHEAVDAVGANFSSSRRFSS